jgi:Cys-tRNA(Pro)/Cys-tRNA(Cys) deacylase
VGLVPVADQLDPKAMAKACGAKRAAMAETVVAERATGYLVGGISPLGQKRRLPTRLDRSAESLTRIYVSAGRRGLELTLSPADLLALCGGRYADIARR